jgi:hypothetical protein
MRGDADHAEARRRELVADYGIDLSVLHASGVTVGELLTRWFAAGHAWEPSTRIGYDHDVRALGHDPIALVRLCSFDQAAMHRAIRRWQATGVTLATVSTRSKAISSGLRWAVEHPAVPPAGGHEVGRAASRELIASARGRVGDVDMADAYRTAPRTLVSRHAVRAT